MIMEQGKDWGGERGERDRINVPESKSPHWRHLLVSVFSLKGRK